MTVNRLTFYSVATPLALLLFCASASIEHSANAATTGACVSSVTTIEGLKAEIGSATASPETKNTLNAIVDQIQAHVDVGNNETARSKLIDFVAEVVRRSNLEPSNLQRILTADANGLICSTANVLTAITPFDITYRLNDAILEITGARSFTSNVNGAESSGPSSLAPS